MKKNLLVLLLAVMLLALLGCAQEPTVTMFNDHVIAMWAQTLEPYAVDIAFLGDSRVALANWQEAYPDREVVNLGIGGDIIEGNIQRLPLLEALDVTHCFLAIGINNCNRDNFSAASFRTQYDILLSELEELGITVYVHTAAGLTAENSTLNATLVNRINANMLVANEIIRDLADDHDMELIDMAALMNNDDGTLKTEYSSDGIHFSAAGNQLWFDTLRPYVDAIP